MCKMSRQEAGRLGAEIANVKLAQARCVRVENYNKNPTLCSQCQVSLSYEKRHNKFCSHSCSASYNNLGQCKNLVSGSFAKKECLHCQKITNNQKYCSEPCGHAHKWAKRCDSFIENGKLPGVAVAKKFLTQSYGDECEICGISEWTGKKLTLILDHINGNADDWSIENLRLICHNCDSLTPTYKGRNKGHGRHARKIRYKEGKSY